MSDKGFKDVCFKQNNGKIVIISTHKSKKGKLYKRKRRIRSDQPQ